MAGDAPAAPPLTSAPKDGFQVHVYQKTIKTLLSKLNAMDSSQRAELQRMAYEEEEQQREKAARYPRLPPHPQRLRPPAPSVVSPTRIERVLPPLARHCPSRIAAAPATNSISLAAIALCFAMHFGLSKALVVLSEDISARLHARGCRRTSSALRCLRTNCTRCSRSCSRQGRDTEHGPQKRAAPAE